MKDKELLITLKGQWKTASSTSIPCWQATAGNYNNLTFKMPYITISDGTLLIAHTCCKKCSHEVFHKHNSYKYAANAYNIYIHRMQSQ